MKDVPKLGIPYEPKKLNSQHFKGLILRSHIKELNLKIGDHVKIVGHFAKNLKEVSGVVSQLVSFDSADPVGSHGFVELTFPSGKTETITDSLFGELILEIDS